MPILVYHSNGEYTAFRSKFNGYSLEETILCERTDEVEEKREKDEKQKMA